MSNCMKRICIKKLSFKTVVEGYLTLKYLLHAVMLSKSIFPLSNLCAMEMTV